MRSSSGKRLSSTATICSVSLRIFLVEADQSKVLDNSIPQFTHDQLGSVVRSWMQRDAVDHDILQAQSSPKKRDFIKALKSRKGGKEPLNRS